MIALFFFLLIYFKRKKIEAIIDCGQPEELYEQAKDELNLIPQYAEWKLWEDPLMQNPVKFLDQAQEDWFKAAIAGTGSAQVEAAKK